MGRCRTDWVAWLGQLRLLASVRKPIRASKTLLLVLHEPDMAATITRQGLMYLVPAQRYKKLRHDAGASVGRTRLEGTAHAELKNAFLAWPRSGLLSTRRRQARE